jgi:hypothetical protein
LPKPFTSRFNTSISRCVNLTVIKFDGFFLLSGYRRGAQRLPTGDTLICNGINGTLFEVTSDRLIVKEKE